MSLRYWWFLAIGFRFIACFTQLSYSHPDEWFQTVEFGHFLSSGVISQTQEFFLHMRNLTWPSWIAMAFSLSEKLAPGNVFVRFTALKFLTAFLDLGLFWGWTRMVLARTRDLPSVWSHLGYALLVLCPMMVPESVRPSQEHLSAIALWVGLGCIATERHFFAGVAGALTGVFRYPSGLLGVAFFAQRRSVWLALFLGGVVGLVWGGLADFFVYGRPYESLWMYLQYNVWSGLAARNFGAQSAAEYWRFFTGAWSGPLIPVGLLFCVLAPVGIVSGVLKKQVWVWSLLLYCVGHTVATAHKEPRFMAPVFLLFLWAAFEGVLVVAPRMQKLKWRRFTPMVAAAVLCVSLSAGLLRQLWGETWRLTDNYLEVSRHLLESKNICAVVSVRRPLSFLLPGSVPVAFFPAERKQSSLLDLQKKPLIWINQKPVCTESRSILVQPYRPDAQWELQHECHLLASGILRWIPRRFWRDPLERGWVAAPWYRCPATVLGLFSKPEVRLILATRLDPLNPLPRYRESAEVILDLLKSRGSGFVDGTLGEF